MRKLHEVVTKKQWFILFNAGTLIALAISGRLSISRESLVTSLLALLIMNGIPAISARSLPNWK